MVRGAIYLAIGIVLIWMWKVMKDGKRALQEIAELNEAK